MSCFLISKLEYTKAAGLMYGIEESKGDSFKWFRDNVRKEFEHCYALNVIAVRGRYDDIDVPNEGQYDAEFETYRKLGRRIFSNYDPRHGMTREQLRPRLMKFFSSVLYQVDDDDTIHRMVAEWLYKCIDRLYECETESVEGWWGDVDLSDEIQAIKKAA